MDEIRTRRVWLTRQHGQCYVWSGPRPGVGADGFYTSPHMQPWFGAVYRSSAMYGSLARLCPDGGCVPVRVVREGERDE